MAGAIWNPLAPAPISATRLPVRSTEWSQRAEWKAGPAKASRPAMSGRLGRLSWPTAEMTARAVSVSSAAVGRPGSARDQVPASSSHVARTTSVSQRTCSSTPWRRITESK